MVFNRKHITVEFMEELVGKDTDIWLKEANTLMKDSHEVKILYA